MNENNICRICRIKKRKNFKSGYGFNLESKTEHRCQFIGIVDPNSPASQAGLRGGDKIVEINNKNIEFLNHDQIIKLIKDGLKINDQIYVDEVLLTVKSINKKNTAKNKDSYSNEIYSSKLQQSVPKPANREPKFLKNLKFDNQQNNQIITKNVNSSSKVITFANNQNSNANSKNSNNFLKVEQVPHFKHSKSMENISSQNKPNIYNSNGSNFMVLPSSNKMPNNRNDSSKEPEIVIFI